MLARLYELAKKKLLGQREPTRAYEPGRETRPDGLGQNIEYYTNQRSQHFGVGIGVGQRDEYGTMISARDLASWLSPLRDCEALWLLPLLDRFAAGEPVTTEDVLRAYEQQHGHLQPYRDIETH